MKIVSLVVAIALITLPAFGQVGSTGQISGRVTDPSSAVLPGVAKAPAVRLNVNFGKITSVADPRIMQFALKYMF